MIKAKQAILAGMVLVTMGASPAAAHDEERSCFSQRTGAGYVRICTERDVNHLDFAWRDHARKYKKEVSYKPVIIKHYYVSPGHGKRIWHHKHNNHKKHYWTYHDKWWFF